MTNYSNISGATRVRQGFEDIVESVKLWEIWSYLATNDVLARYKQTLLGPLWNVSFIVSQALALSIVFGSVFGQKLSDMLPYILSGMVAYNLSAGFLIESTNLLLSSAGTIKTQKFPYFFYLFRAALRTILMFLHNLVGILIVFPLVGHFPALSWTLLFMVLLAVLAMLPYCILLAMLCSRFRDINAMVNNFAPILFFVTPIFWRPEGSGGIRKLIYEYNPFYYLVEIVRRPLLGHMPLFSHVGVVVGIFGIGCVLLTVTFPFNRYKIPHWV